MVGAYMVGLPASDEKYQIYAMHKSFGVVVLALVISRIIIRLNSKIPALPIEINSLENKLSALMVFLLYCCMVLMPFSGLTMAMASGKGINFFGIFDIPNFKGLHPTLATFAWKSHGFIATIIFTLIIIHILAGFKHLLLQKVNIFKRML